MNFERMRTRHIIGFVVAVFVMLFWIRQYMRVIVIRVNGNTKAEILNYVKGMSNVKDDNTKQGAAVNHTKTCSCLTDGNSKQTMTNEKTETLSDSSTELGNMNYTEIVSLLNRAKVLADNKLLVEVLRKHFIQPPSTLPYNLTKPEVIDPSPKQTQIIDKLLNNKTGGFYIECGAHDGEFLSNSLFLERFRSWNGVLIEPNPFSYKRLKSKNRKAYTLNACLSFTTSPQLVTFFTGKFPALGQIVERSDNTTLSPKHIKAQCFPLYAVLLALDMPTIDYFSLDVEGAEQGVLESLPWDKVDIRTLSIEWNLWKGGKPNLTAYMERKGYSMVTEVNLGFAPDLIFMKK